MERKINTQGREPTNPKDGFLKISMKQSKFSARLFIKRDRRVTNNKDQK